MSCSPVSALPSSRHLRGFRRVLDGRRGSRRRGRCHGSCWHGSRSSVLRFVFRAGGGDGPDLPPGGQLLQGSWRKEVADTCQVAEVTPRWPRRGSRTSCPVGCVRPLLLRVLLSPWLMDERSSLLTLAPKGMPLCNQKGLCLPLGEYWI